MAYEGEAARLMKLLRLLASVPCGNRHRLVRGRLLLRLIAERLRLLSLIRDRLLGRGLLRLLSGRLLLRRLFRLCRATRGARLRPKAQGPSDGTAADAPRAASSEGLLSMKSAAFSVVTTSAIASLTSEKSSCVP